MTSKEKAIVIEAVRLIARNGTEAIRAVEDAFSRNEIDRDEVDEWVAQVVDLPASLGIG